jgi:hypothetical protein
MAKQIIYGEQSRQAICADGCGTSFPRSIGASHHFDRDGELRIVRDAKLLKQQAQDRIPELETPCGAEIVTS